MAFEDKESCEAHLYFLLYELVRMWGRTLLSYMQASHFKAKVMHQVWHLEEFLSMCIPSYFKGKVMHQVWPLEESLSMCIPSRYDFKKEASSKPLTRRLPLYL